jgi:hypothetical protein
MIFLRTGRASCERAQLSILLDAVCAFLVYIAIDSAHRPDLWITAVDIGLNGSIEAISAISEDTARTTLVSTVGNLVANK